MLGLRKTLSSLFSRNSIDESLFESLEESLLLADVGIHATEYLIKELRTTVKKEKITDIEGLKNCLSRLIAQQLECLSTGNNPLVKLNPEHHPEVWLIVGVNGAGKTTTIGKICKALQTQNKKVILAAGDTFRAAAREQ